MVFHVKRTDPTEEMLGGIAVTAASEIIEISMTDNKKLKKIMMTFRKFKRASSKKNDL